MDIDFNEKMLKIIKNKNIFIIFEDFNIEFGGLTNTVFKRANYLADNGYKISLLNVDPMRNFEYIQEGFIKSNILSPNVKFINVYDYYSKKNTSSQNSKVSIKPNFNKDGNYSVNEIYNTDGSIQFNYFDSSNILIKSEVYIDDVLVFDEVYEPPHKRYFTKDGFKYLEMDENYIFSLFDRNSDKTLKFNGINEFLYHFMDEMCEGIEDKPFLLCDSTSHYYNMNGVKSDVYKIGVMHGNPYVFDNESVDYISPRINHLSHLDDLEAIVVLTNEVKEDLINELKKDKFAVIPNFISDEALETELVPKEVNRIRIFSRISSEKQISDAIKAFKIVSDSKPDAVLEIFGRAITNDERAELLKLENLVNKLNLEDKILFKGFLSDVNIEMQKSLCTLIISKHEGLPLSLLESMANATPVICYDFKYAPKDVITNGVDGIIVEKGNIELLAEKMIELLDDPEFAINLGINAREKIKNSFSTSSTAYKWEELFKSVFVDATLNDLDKKSNKIEKLNSKNDKLKSKNKKLKSKNKKLKSKNEKLKEMNNSIINSKSWKLTKPLRKLSNLSKK